MDLRILQKNLIKLSLIFFAISILLLLHSSYTKVSGFSEENIIGLAGTLTECYWLGLTSVLLSIFFLIFSPNCYKYEKMFLAEALLFAIYLYAIPALVEENVYFHDTWGHLTGSVSILINGNYDKTGNWYVTQYPGAFILSSITVLVSGMDPITFVKHYPIIISGYIVLVSYLLFRKCLTNKKMSYFATIFFVSGSVWVFPKHFCPNSPAFILFLLIFYLSLSKGTLKNILLSIFLVATITVTHPTTMPFLIFSVTLIPITFKLWSKRIKNIQLNTQFSLLKFLPFFTIIIWSAWSVFNATGVFTYLINTVEKFFGSLSEFVSIGKPTERFAVTSPLMIGQTLKMSYTFLYVFVSFIGTFYLAFDIFKKKKMENARLFAVMGGWFIACVILGVATALLQGGEFYERILLYGFIPLSVFAIFTLRNKYGKSVFILAILIGTYLSIFASYTNEYFEYTPITDSYGSIFMVSHNITQNVKIGIPTFGLYKFYIYYRIYRAGSDIESSTPTKNTFFVWSKVSYTCYVVYIKGREYTQLQGWMLRMTWMDKYPSMLYQPNSSLIYNNGNFHVICANISE